MASYDGIDVQAKRTVTVKFKDGSAALMIMDTLTHGVRIKSLDDDPFTAASFFVNVIAEYYTLPVLVPPHRMTDRRAARAVEIFQKAARLLTAEVSFSTVNLRRDPIV